MNDIFGFLGMLGAMMAVMWVLPIFPFLYIVVRWRGGEGQPSGSGTYAAMVYFTTVSVLLALAGAANLTYGFVSVTDVDPEMTRVSWGLLIGSVAFFALNFVLLRTIGAEHGSTDIARVFLGFVMVVAGIVAMGSLIMMTIELMRETATDHAAEQRSDEIRMYGAWAFYFLATYLFSTRTLMRQSRQ